MDGKTLGIVLGIYALILWVLIFFVWHKGYKEWKTNRLNRVYKYRARIVDKTERTEQDGSTAYFLVFDIKGRREALRVDDSVYSSFRIGEEGDLGVRRGQYESFEPKSEGERADEIYRRMTGR